MKTQAPLLLLLSLALAPGLLAAEIPDPATIPAANQAPPAGSYLPIRQERLGSAFAYQGRLKSGAADANGRFDFVFAVFAAPTGGVALQTNRLAGVPVAEGIFSVELDFGDGIFGGYERWLEISVRRYSSSGIYTELFSALSPRQRIQPVPYALYAPLAGSLPESVTQSFVPKAGDSTLSGSLVVNSLVDRELAIKGFTTGQDAAALVGVANNGSQAMGIMGRSTSGYAGWFDGRVFINDESGLDSPHLAIFETKTNNFARLELHSIGKAFWHIAAGGDHNFLNFYNSSRGDVMSLSEQGELTVKVLTITGGADLVEPFPTSGAEVAKGSVMIIDEANPGKLKISDRAYDTRVAGIVSGANGVNPGISMRQQGLVDGSQPVALSGRVYVLADAQNGPIKPGDLLTTSAVPGHAMKVTDHPRAQGAILGKAMAHLAQGRGLLLVLVTLQ
jgi:hypothetical protein